ncbi:MAG: enoyl-CoA hydratase [Rhodospirillales bacterium]|nr:MAG: enoyl-CoA hydratase [Rhodospirillales bacterium]
MTPSATAPTATPTATPATTTQPAPPAPLVLRHDADGIATLTLNRPQQFNALSVALLAALQAELDRLKDDTSIRVVVLAGAGKAFSAGHDLKEMRENPDRHAIEALFEQCSRVMLSIVGLPQPVIARVHGIATAAGCQLVATCDLAVAADTARFAVSGVNLGLFCSTPMVPLTRNLPRKQAMEMLLTGDFIDAATALHYGLVNRVVPVAQLDAAVADLAGRIGAKSPTAIALGKRLFYRQIEAGLEAAYAEAGKTMTCNMMADDAQAGIDAFIAKQPMPRWQRR